ncbi:hypothetical protein CEXT_479271 [Caerostris extrusa]|uniref:Uncharacterized protein n=1 Tax=Caerostris extrusa TaxID=172846 RepID=A0AAV4U0N6_CAEEX|nr:hypothetical protein CEXT_479271 [Caerostris extrusa]
MGSAIYTLVSSSLGPAALHDVKRHAAHLFLAISQSSIRIVGNPRSDNRQLQAYDPDTSPFCPPLSLAGHEMNGASLWRFNKI